MFGTGLYGMQVFQACLPEFQTTNKGLVSVDLTMEFSEMCSCTIFQAMGSAVLIVWLCGPCMQEPLGAQFCNGLPSQHSQVLTAQQSLPTWL